MSTTLPRMTRRHWARMFTGGILALPPAVLPEEAGAFRKWCKTDPQITIDDQKAHIYVAAFVKNNKTARSLAHEPIQIVVTIPKGIKYKKIHGSNGFGEGYDSTVVESDTLVATAEVVPVQISVTVPMLNDGIAVKSWLVPKSQGRLRSGEGQGTSNVEFTYTAE